MTGRSRGETNKRRGRAPAPMPVERYAEGECEVCRAVTKHVHTPGGMCTCTRCGRTAYIGTDGLYG